MAVSNEAGFLSEVLHLHAKDHVAPDLLITDSIRFIIIEELEGWFDAGLFLRDGVCPEVVAIFSIIFKSVFN